MRDWSYISNISDVEISGVQCMNGRFVIWIWIFDYNFQIFDVVFFYGFCVMFCCNLSCEWSGFVRIMEIGIIGCCLIQCVILMISDGNDGVVKRSMDMSYVVRDLFFYMFMCMNWCFCYYLIILIIF